MAKPPTQPKFREKLWKSIEEPLIIILGDILLFLVALGGLIVGMYAFPFLAAKGMKPERVELLETVHFWSYFAILLIFGIDMAFKMAAHSFKRPKP